MSVLSPSKESGASPHQHLSLFDSASIIVGIIIGVTIYRSPGEIAGCVPNVGWLVGVWTLGAVFTIVGALCYAELATAFPKEGGDYVFLNEAFGRKVGFLFAWSQFWLVRPGSLGVFAFAFAEYAQTIFPLPAACRPLLSYAAGSVVVLSGVNLLGVRAGKWTQNVLAVVKFLGLLAIVAAGLAFSPTNSSPSAEPAHQLNLGFAMILVFYAYSGWNEMAYVSAEVRNPRRNIPWALVLGTLAVSAIYIAANLAYVRALGLAGLQHSKTVAHDVLAPAIGPRAAKAVSLLVCVTALGGINGMVFTGARIFYAVGTDHRLFSWMGRWNSVADTPARPLIIQAAVTVAVILGFGSGEKADGFVEAIVFTSPAFWLFLYLVGHALFVLRARRPGPITTYRAPLYPVLPLAFCLSSAYMFFASVEYAWDNTFWSLMASVAVMAVGALFVIGMRNEQPKGVASRQ